MFCVNKYIYILCLCSNNDIIYVMNHFCTYDELKSFFILYIVGMVFFRCNKGLKNKGYYRVY